MIKKKGQSTLEYSVVIAVIVGALLAMQIYIKRGYEGRLRASIDSVGSQYEAGRTTSRVVTRNTQDGTTIELTGLTVSNAASNVIGIQDASIVFTVDTNTGKGVTRTEVITPAIQERTTDSAVEATAVSEKITVGVDPANSPLMSVSGTLFD